MVKDQAILVINSDFNKYPFVNRSARIKQTQTKNRLTEIYCSSHHKFGAKNFLIEIDNDYDNTVIVKAGFYYLVVLSNNCTTVAVTTLLCNKATQEILHNKYYFF